MTTKTNENTTETTEKFIYIVIYDFEKESKTGRRFELVKFPLIRKSKNEKYYFYYDPKDDERIQTISAEYLFDKATEEYRTKKLGEFLGNVSFSIPFSTKKAAIDFMSKYSSDLDFENAKKEAYKLINKKILDDIADAIARRAIICSRSGYDFNIDNFLADIKSKFEERSTKSDSAKALKK